MGKHGLLLGRGPHVVCTQKRQQWMYPEGERGPTPASVHTTLPRLAEFTETVGMRAINLFDWGEFSSLKPTFFFPHIILAFGFTVRAL